MRDRLLKVVPLPMKTSIDAAFHAPLPTEFGFKQGITYTARKPAAEALAVFALGPLKGKPVAEQSTAQLENVKVWLLRRVEAAVAEDDTEGCIALHREVRLIDDERKRRWERFLAK